MFGHQLPHPSISLSLSNSSRSLSVCRREESSEVVKNQITRECRGSSQYVFWWTARLRWASLVRLCHLYAVDCKVSFFCNARWCNNETFILVFKPVFKKYFFCSHVWWVGLTYSYSGLWRRKSFPPKSYSLCTRSPDTQVDIQFQLQCIHVRHFLSNFFKCWSTKWLALFIEKRFSNCSE